MACCAGEKLSESSAGDVRQLCTTLLNCYLIQARARGRLAPPRRQADGRHPQCPRVPGWVMRLGISWSSPPPLCVLALRIGVMCGNYEPLLVMVGMSAVFVQLTTAWCWRVLTMRFCCARSYWRRACCMLTRTRVRRCPALQWPHLTTQPPHVRLSAHVDRSKRSLHSATCMCARPPRAGRMPRAGARRSARQATVARRPPPVVYSNKRMNENARRAQAT